MRARCEIAIDQTGHELSATVVKVELAAGSEILGGLRGDLQSLDGEGIRYCYYLRPGSDEVLPKWLSNLARASHHLRGVKLYIVVYELITSFERSCKAAGAGLLVLTEDNVFDHQLDFDTTLPEELEGTFKARLDGLRRAMESKLALNLDRLQDRFNQIGDLTREMPDDVAEKYRQRVEREHRLWSAWGDDLSGLLDAAATNRSAADLDAIEEFIEEGPDLDADVEEDE